MAAAGTAAGEDIATAAGMLTALASVSTRAMSSPDATVLPSVLRISVSTPDAGAGTSRTTLSVSISMRISSALTASPGFFFHSSRVASATDSESCGTLTSWMDMFVSFQWELDNLRMLKSGEGGLEQLLLPHVMLLEIA